ncbi:MAG: hypothetical protein SFX18_16610 [Pirellulales bacterium]|nr:hypothetical protein [Pirellulales bacterium]
MLVTAVNRPEIPPFPMPDRFRTDIAYFMSAPDENQAPRLPPGEYWIDLTHSRQWLADGVVEIISPLDSLQRREVEISEEQEAWLGWMVNNQIQHVRIGD